MKQKGENSDLVTKGYLGTTLDRQFTEFEGVINGRFDEFEDRLDQKLDDKLTKAMDKLYTRIDPLLSELENSRDDRTITTDQIANLDRRVATLENNN